MGGSHAGGEPVVSWVGGEVEATARVLRDVRTEGGREGGGRNGGILGVLAERRLQGGALFALI